jgi:phage gp36-like protein
MADVLATVEDVRLALGEDVLHAVADFTSDGSYDDEHVERALRRASDVARSYFNYALPDPPPPALVGYVVDVAVWFMANARGISADPLKDAYTAAIAWFRDAAAGKVQLVPATGTAAETFVLDPEADGRDRTWTQDTGGKIF